MQIHGQDSRQILPGTSRNVSQMPSPRVCGMATGNGQVSVPPRHPLQCQCWSQVAVLHQPLGHGRVGHSLLAMQSCIITEMHANRLIRKGIKNAMFSLVHCRFQLVICVGKRPRSWGWKCRCVCAGNAEGRGLEKQPPLSVLDGKGDGRAKKLNWILWLLSVGYGVSHVLDLFEKQWT